MDFHGIISQTLMDADTVEAFNLLDAAREEFIEDWKKLAKMYSPSGNEGERARFIAERLRGMGYGNVSIDRHGNPVAWIDGEEKGPMTAFYGTMDDLATIAELVKSSDKPIMETGGQLIGPATNVTATCASLLALAAMLKKYPPKRGRVYLVGVVQEETGLTGARGFLRDHPEVDYLIDIMAGAGRVSYGAIGIHWFKVHFKGPKGHTLRGDGPNVTKGVAKAVTGVWSLKIPREPELEKVFLNISMLGAGEVFNHRHDDGWFSVDLRSFNNGNLEAARAEIINVAKSVAREEELECWIEDVQRGKPGVIPGARDSKLVRLAEEGLKALGVKPELSPWGSSNFNAGVEIGVPSISLGGNRGGGRNTLEEYANIEPVFTGVKLYFLMAQSLFL